MNADLAEAAPLVISASKRPWVIGVAFAAIGVIAIIGHSISGPPRGFDIKCEDFAAMNHQDQVAVMVSAGVVTDHIDDRIAYNLQQCRDHPERQIGQNF
ncbi:MAG: hypothetical protein ACJ72E_11445 [Marmoricola sp.]